MQEDQRRQHQRVDLVLRVEYADAQNYFAEWTENLSAGGLFVRTERMFEKGDSVQLLLSFPGLLSPAAVEGHVVWIRAATQLLPRGVGVEVVGDNARRRLAELAALALQPVEAHQADLFTLLIVEDNIQIAQSYERVVQRLRTLTDKRVEVVFATNGYEALEALQKQPINLVLTDVYMPVMDGLALLEHMKGAPQMRNIPVIVASGGHDDIRIRAERLGAQAFLHKPVQFGQILETVVRLVNVK